MHADYFDTFEQVQEALSTTDEKTIVIVFTAGDLDYQLRKWLKLC